MHTTVYTWTSEDNFVDVGDRTQVLRLGSKRFTY